MAGGLFSGLQNTLFGSNSGGSQAAALQAALGLMGAANVPQLGNLNMSQVGASSAGNSQADLYYDQATKKALENLNAEKGQLSQADLANLDAANRRISQQVGSTIGGIRNQNAARGIGGSGVDMALQAAQGQQAANAASEAGASALGNAQNRFMQARSQGADLASQMQGQTFAQDIARNTAKDAREELNRSILNQNLYYNTVGKPMNQFGMQNQATQTAMGGLGSMGNQANVAQQQSNQFGNAIIGAGGQVLGAYAGKPDVPNPYLVTAPGGKAHQR